MLSFTHDKEGRGTLMAKAIYDPALARVDDISATSASFVIEPLHKGYGNTLGN